MSYYCINTYIFYALFISYDPNANWFTTQIFIFPEEWSENFPYQLLIVAGVALVGLVLLAAISFQCSSTWRWLINMTRHENIEDAETEVQHNAIRISHSLPDLQSEPITHEYVQEQKDNKKVLLANSNLIKRSVKFCDCFNVDISAGAASNHFTHRANETSKLPTSIIASA